MDKYYNNGKIKAKFIGYLKPGECSCKWEKDPMNFTDSNKKYTRVTE